jgi:hypothetical protein
MECYNSDTNKGEAQAYNQWQRQQKLKNKTVDETTLKAKEKRQGPQQKLKNKTVDETTLKVNKKRQRPKQKLKNKTVDETTVVL